MNGWLNIFLPDFYRSVKKKNPEIPEGVRVPILAPGKMYGCITTGAFYPFAPGSQGNWTEY